MAEERATVLRVDRKRVVVDLDDGTLLDARLRGRVVAARGVASAVAVGDRVVVERQAAGPAAIVRVEPRAGVLMRPEVLGRGNHQVLVANADRGVLVFAHRDPAPAAGLVDRLLVACHAGEVPPVLVFNKCDLEPTGEAAELIQLYERLGYEVLRTSAERGDGLSALTSLLRDRCSVFAGPSGTGKSSLLNRVVPGISLRTGEISATSGKGRHTTTAAELVRIPGGRGHVVDTPGVKEFGLAGIKPRDLALQFPEFPVPNQCRFLDCRHETEPGCEVVAAVASGAVSRSRHLSYLTFLEELEAENDSAFSLGPRGHRRSGGS